MLVSRLVSRLAEKKVYCVLVFRLAECYFCFFNKISIEVVNNLSTACACDGLDSEREFHESDQPDLSPHTCTVSCVGRVNLVYSIEDCHACGQ